jgi:hypothetical protein
LADLGRRHLPVNSDQHPFVVWENWIEQAQLYPANPSQNRKVPNSGASAAPHPERLQVQLAFGMIVGVSAQATLPASPERRYALREIKARYTKHRSAMPS